MAFSPDGRRALSGSGDIRKGGFLWLKYTPVDCTMRLWDIETGVQLHCFEGHTTNVASVAFAPDGRHLVSGDVDGRSRVWRLTPPR